MTSALAIALLQLHTVALGDFTPSGKTTYADLAAIIRRQSPSVEGVRGAVEDAQANLRQTQIYDNPQLALGVHQIPLGTTNPPGLRALDQVMAYSAELGYRIEIAKRGARQAREGYTLRAQQALMFQTARLRTLDLARVLGEIAAATARMSIAKARADETRALPLQKTALSSMELGRLELEGFRLEQVALDDAGAEAAALAACAALIAAHCNAFADADAARAYLERWLDEPIDDVQTPLENRWDLRAIDTLRRAADEDLRLGNATAIPDPTLRLGYLHDRLTIAGHQLNTLSVSLSIPLPLFEQGQAHSQAAAARSARLLDTRARALLAGKLRLAELGNQLLVQKQRRDLLRTKALPRAHEVLAEQERAWTQKALGLTELLDTRRAHDALRLQEVDALFDGFLATIDVLIELPDPSAAAGADN